MSDSHSTALAPCTCDTGPPDWPDMFPYHWSSQESDGVRWRREGGLVTSLEGDEQYGLAGGLIEGWTLVGIGPSYRPMAALMHEHQSGEGRVYMDCPMFSGPWVAPEDRVASAVVNGTVIPLAPGWPRQMAALGPVYSYAVLEPEVDGTWFWDDWVSGLAARWLVREADILVGQVEALLAPGRAKKTSKDQEAR